VGVVLLAVAGIAFFFIAGWWALLASPFLLIAALLAYRSSRVRQQVYRPNEQEMLK
jgi:MFS-type transporter involved in bile tolerance (Atg22 family)